jgi:hypothetical protein
MKKICARCKIEKDAFEFENKKNICKECYNFFKENYEKLFRSYERELFKRKKVENKFFNLNNRLKKIFEYKFSKKEEDLILKINEVNCLEQKLIDKYNKKEEDLIKKYIKKEKILKSKNEIELKKYKSKLKNDEKIITTKKSIRNLINNSIKKNGYKKSSKTVDILGCTFDEFKLYIESQFQPWMNWDNYGKYNGQLNYGWDLDHIIPLSSAKNEKEIIKLNHYTNFQPLCTYVNRYVKRNHY